MVFGGDHCLLELPLHLHQAASYCARVKHCWTHILVRLMQRVTGSQATYSGCGLGLGQLALRLTRHWMTSLRSV